MKIGIFTDSHYSSQEITCGIRRNSESLRKIKEAYKFFKKETCDLVISLGDLIDIEDDHNKEINNLKQISEVIRQSDIPTICVMGNHDGFAFEAEEFYQILGENCRPETITDNKTNLVFIDACYFENGEHYYPGDFDWKDTYYPLTKELKTELDSLSGEIYIFIHQNIDPEICESHCLKNDEEVRSILEKCGKVKTVYQGHYHNGNKNTHNGINYFTYPAMCEDENRYYVLEV